MSNDEFWDSVQAVAESDFPAEGLKTLCYYAEQLEKDGIRYERFSPQEQRGLLRGGRAHAIASLLAGTENRADRKSQGGCRSGAQRQEYLIESWARRTGLWTDDVRGSLTTAYGAEIDCGMESLVFDAGADVVKTLRLDAYATPQLALDRITLHNALFPETAMTVLGFGRLSDGPFCAIVSQTFIQGEAAVAADIENKAAAMGMERNAQKGGGFVAEFFSESISIRDLHEGNMIVDGQGNRFVIDCELRINTPELGLGGERVLSNAIDASMLGIRRENADKTDIPEKVVVNTSLAAILNKWSQDHIAAKGGDEDAAGRIVKGVCKNAKYDQWKSLPDDVVFVPVKGLDGIGSKNAIPTELARWAAVLAERGCQASIRQKERVGHTGASKADRFLRRARFEGFVEYGRNYILVDDHVTMGGTLMAMARYIRDRGGIVAGATSLSASAGGSNFRITDSVLSRLREADGDGRLEDLLKEKFGLSRGFEDLTNSEGNHILKGNKREALIEQLSQIESNIEVDRQESDARDLIAFFDKTLAENPGCVPVIKVGAGYFAFGKVAETLGAVGIGETKCGDFGHWLFFQQQEIGNVLRTGKSLGLRIGIADAPDSFNGQEWKMLDQFEASISRQFGRGR